MANAIAFFPWIYLEAPLSIGPVRLLPFHKGKLPGNLPNVGQLDIDGIFGAYSNRPTFPVKRGALLEVGEWYSGMEMTQSILDDLFRAREMLTFSALAERRLFHGHFHYTNSDAYALTVQRYEPGKPGVFAFTTRRRDGGATQVWSSNQFAFHRPAHIDANWKFGVDTALADALLGLSVEETGIYEAIVEFNAANTDSSAVPPHVEVVMCKTAFEWLLEIDEGRKSFNDALTLHFPSTTKYPVSGELLKAWAQRWGGVGTRAISSWASEFCVVRGSAAHGKEKPKSFIWGEAQHLAFVSILFPLLVKKVLADKGLYVLTAHDKDHIEHLEGYLQTDPFTAEATPEEGQHAWAEVRSRSRMKGLARLIYPDMDSGD